MAKLPGALEQSTVFHSAVAADSLSAIWQILAILAVAGLAIVILLAIIEPGPLVKKRPFPKRQRRSVHTPNEAEPAQQEMDSSKGGDGEHAKQRGGSH